MIRKTVLYRAYTTIKTNYSSNEEKKIDNVD